MLLLIDPGLMSSPTLIFFDVNEDKILALSNLKSVCRSKTNNQKLNKLNKSRWNNYEG